MLSAEKNAEESISNFDLKMSCAVIGDVIYRTGGEVRSFYKLLNFVDFRHLCA